MKTEQMLLTLTDQTQLSLNRHKADVPNGLPPIMLVHGYGEHIGRYAHVVDFLNQRGFEVWGYDARGHGVSQGARGFIAADDTLPNDCVAVFNHIAQATQRTPIIIAHSMGGLTAALAVTLKNLKPSALVLSSPALRLFMNLPQKIMLQVGLALMPNKPIKSPAVAVDYISHDAHVRRAYSADPLNHCMISPRLVRFMRDGGDVVRANAAQFTMPTLLIYGGADRVIDPSGSDDLAAVLPASATVKRYVDGYHEIFNEAEPLRGQVLRHMGDWLMDNAS